MGFTKGVPITDDADIFEIAFEQEITNVLRELDANSDPITTLAALHITGVNMLIRTIPPSIDITTITNTDDFKFEVIYWILMTIYRGEAPDGMGRRPKHDEYRKDWMEQKATRRYEFEDGTKLGPGGTTTGLPVAANHDTGEFFPGACNYGPNPNNSALVKSPDDSIFNRPR